MYALLKHTDRISDEMTPTEKAELMAESYVEGSTAYEEDEKAKQEIVEINQKIYKIAAAGEEVVAKLEEEVEASEGGAKSDVEKDLLIAKVYYWGRKASYQYFEDFYRNIGVKFDRYYPESTVAGKGLEVVKRELKNGVYEESDGAVVFKGEKYGLHTRVFINKMGCQPMRQKMLV